MRVTNCVFFWKSKIFKKGCLFCPWFCAIEKWGGIFSNTCRSAVKMHKWMQAKLCNPTKIKNFRKKCIKSAFSLPTKWGDFYFWRFFKRVFRFGSILCDRLLRGIFRKCIFHRRRSAQTGDAEIVQVYKNKKISKKAAKNRVFAAYQVRGFGKCLLHNRENA